VGGGEEVFLGSRSQGSWRRAGGRATPIRRRQSRGLLLPARGGSRSRTATCRVRLGRTAFGLSAKRGI